MAGWSVKHILLLFSALTECILSFNMLLVIFLVQLSPLLPSVIIMLNMLFSPACVISSQNLFSFTNYIRIMQPVFSDDPNLIVEDVDFCYTHLVLITREGWNFRLCSVSLPLLSEKVIEQVHLMEELGRVI